MMNCKLFRTFVNHEGCKHIDDDIFSCQLCYDAQRFCQDS